MRSTWVCPKAAHTKSPLWAPVRTRLGNCRPCFRNAFTVAIADPVLRKVSNNKRKHCCTCLSGSSTNAPSESSLLSDEHLDSWHPLLAAVQQHSREDQNDLGARTLRKNHLVRGGSKFFGWR